MAALESDLNVGESKMGLHVLVYTVANNQLSGAYETQIDLIDFLYKPSSCLYRANSYPFALVTHLEVSD